jgi:molecular chaperone DnaJ
MCNGHGQVRFQQGFFSITRTCSQCGGTGKIVKNPCKACKGEGRVVKEKNLDLKIPAGVDNGDKMRVSGEGDAGEKGAPDGDLYVVLSVKDHPVFERREHHLYCHIPISFPQAALGSDIMVPTLEGEEVALKVPAGTQTGSLFRIKNRGVSKRGGSTRGDLYVTVDVAVPSKLNKEQKDIIGRLADTLEDDNRPTEKRLLDRMKEIFS